MWTTAATMEYLLHLILKELPSDRYSSYGKQPIGNKIRPNNFYRIIWPKVRDRNQKSNKLESIWCGLQTDQNRRRSCTKIKSRMDSLPLGKYTQYCIVQRKSIILDNLIVSQILIISLYCGFKNIKKSEETRKPMDKKSSHWPHI